LWIDTSGERIFPSNHDFILIFAENLPETLEILFSYSLLKRRGIDGISLHPLVQLWAKERLDKDRQVAMARDAVILVAEEHLRKREQTNFLAGKFSRHFYPQTVRCLQLIERSLSHVLPTTEDVALLLSVEQIAVDFVYSSNFAAARDLLVLLSHNPRSKQRAYCITEVFQQHLHYPVEVTFNFEEKRAVLQEMELIALSGVGSTATINSCMAWVRKSILSLERELPRYDPILTPMVERHKLLQDLEELDKELRSRFRYGDWADWAEAEEFVREEHRLRGLINRLSEQFRVLDTLLKKWKKGLTCFD
jgi:hypothetical protein